MPTKMVAACGLWLATLALLTARVVTESLHLTMPTLVAMGLAMLVTFDIQLDRHRAKVAELVYLATITRHVPVQRRETEPTHLRERQSA